MENSVGEVTETFGKEKFHVLDFLRGVAAFIVALAHFSYGTIRFGHTAAGMCVIFFFILSGYVLSYAYRAQIKNRTFLFKDYIVSRFARLYPLHFITFVLVALYWLLIEAAKHFSLPINATNSWSIETIIENLTLTHLLLQDSVSFNSPAWSISVEFWCSLYIFFLCSPGRALAKIIAILLIGSAFAVVEMNGGFLGNENHWVKGFLEKNYVTGLACFTLGWALYSAELYFEVTPTALSALQNRTAQIVMQKSGELSFGIYLWHIPIMLGLSTGARAIEITTGAKVIGTQVMNVFFIGLLFPIAWLSYRYIEMPAKHWIRRKWQGVRV